MKELYSSFIEHKNYFQQKEDTNMKIFSIKAYLISGLLTLVLALFISFNVGKTDLAAIAQASSANLIGTWDYKVSLVSQTYQIQISNYNGQLVGKYLVPNTNNSTFEIKVFESERGRPVITIAQIALGQPNYTYRAALSGRLDNNTLLTGNIVDVDNNRATFEMRKL
jgi:hypothetical protein